MTTEKEMKIPKPNKLPLVKVLIGYAILNKSRSNISFCSNISGDSFRIFSTKKYAQLAMDENEIELNRLVKVQIVFEKGNKK